MSISDITIAALLQPMLLSSGAFRPMSLNDAAMQTASRMPTLVTRQTAADRRHMAPVVSVSDSSGSSASRLPVAGARYR